MATKNQLQRDLDECRANRTTDKATISKQADEIAGLKLALADCEGTEPTPTPTPTPAPTTWRPFAATSLFNVPIPASPPLDPSSQSICAQYAKDHPSPSVNPKDGWTHPIYWARATDPEHVITLREPWGTATQNMKIRIPAGAQPEGAGVSPADSHIAIVQPDGMCYDFWSDGFKNVRTEITPGRIVASWGGRGSITGNSFNMGATAARYGLAAGVITGAELKAGKIEHALFCVSKTNNGIKTNGAVGVNKPDPSKIGVYPAMGQRFMFAYTDAEIAAVSNPLERAVKRALKVYGMFNGDNGGGMLKAESPLTVYQDGSKRVLYDLLNGQNLPLNLDFSKLRALA